MRSTLLFALFAIATAACSSSSSGTSDGTVSRSKKLSDLTPADEGAMCDSIAPSLGGYGSAPKTTTCSDGSTVTTKPYANQAACVQGFGTLPAACPATVGDAEDCVSSLNADPCSTTLTAACASFFNQACSSDSEPPDSGAGSDSATSD